VGEISRASLDLNLTVKPNLIGGANERRGMSDRLPSAYLARHGNTAWTHSGQDTDLTDLPLTPEGERNAVRLGERLKGLTFAKVLPVRCSVLLEPANSPDLGRSPKPMATWRNGTMGNMKG
jgi:hypothetical protein